MGGGRGGGWTNTFEEENNPRIVLEINSASQADDMVGLDVSWTELELRLLDGDPNLVYIVQGFDVTGDGDISPAEYYVGLSMDEPVAVCVLRGLTVGDISISVNAEDVTCSPINGDVVEPISTPYGDPTVNPTIPAANGPNSSNEIEYSTAATGIATLQCEARKVVKDPSMLRWAIDGDTRPTWAPNDGNGKGTGLNPTGTYSGLPLDNDGFGLKTISLTAPDFSGDVVTQQIELFYPRDATNHPGGTTPNWFYYWTQTSANKGTMHYDGTLAGGGQTTWNAPNYSAYLGQSVVGPYRTPDVGANANTNLNGINHFAWTARHEWRHHEQMTDWWGAGGWVAANDADTTGQDGIPDALEAGIAAGDGGPFDNTKKDTFGTDSLSNDMERHAVFTQDVWTVNSANNEDWGNPGMRHHTLNKYDD